MGEVQFIVTPQQPTPSVTSMPGISMPGISTYIYTVSNA